MIVPMRKLSLLIFYRDYQAFLGELREKGVVHIHENKKRSAEDEELKHKFAGIKRIRSNRIGFADFSGKPVQTNGTY